MGDVVINCRFLTQRLTGVQRYALELTRRLGGLDQDGRLHLYAPPMPEVDPSLGLRVETVGMGRGQFWEQVSLGLAANRPGRVLWSPCNTGPLIARNHVVTIHDLFAIEHPEWVGRAFHEWYAFMLPLLARRVRQIVTVSEYSKSRITEVLGVSQDKVTVVYPGVDEAFRPVAEEAKEALREKYNLPPDYILTLGSLEPRKNLDRVIAAWSILPPDERLPLVVAGGAGSNRVFGRYSLADRPLSNEVKFLGYVPDADLPALYSAASVLVYASLAEGFGLPLIEALACGARAVGSKTTAMPESAGELAVLVDPLDEQSIAEGIRRALRLPPNGDDDIRSLRERFDWAKAAYRVWQIIAP